MKNILRLIICLLFAASIMVSFNSCEIPFLNNNELDTPETPEAPEEPDEPEIVENETPVVPDNPEKDGYVFKGWADANGEIVPGEFVTIDELKNNQVKISAKIMKNFEHDTITAVRIYSADKVIWSQTDINQDEIDLSVSLKDYELDKYVRVEVEGTTGYHICASTPFFIQK